MVIPGRCAEQSYEDGGLQIHLLYGRVLQARWKVSADPGMTIQHHSNCISTVLWRYSSLDYGCILRRTNWKEDIMVAEGCVSDLSILHSVAGWVAALDQDNPEL
ncbi:hypothetical protein RRG08_054367 [Elysia crispata]|uniref:Uncharacterized protein n=1 Tax=Elysia crispata TaxID=231223 RepID=A0AAE1B5K1_9GAST|nr:hypothetical protein RRG08_054367 [Elysia crispata]